MASAVLGSLKILLGLDSAQIVTDVGRARTAVRSGMDDMEAHASTAMSAVTAQIGKVGPALRGTQQVTAVAMKGFELMGQHGSAAVGAIGNAVSGLLAGGFTPLGIALGAVTSGVALLASQKDEIVSVFAATEERAKSAREALEKVRLELGLLSRGKLPTATNVDLSGAEDELRRRRLILQRERDAGMLGSEGAGSFWRNAGNSVLPFKALGVLPSIDSAAQSAERLVKAQEEHVRLLREVDQRTQLRIDSEAALRTAKAMTYDPTKNSSPWYAADPEISRVMSLDPPKEWLDEQRRRDAAISAAVKRLLARQFDSDGSSGPADPYSGFEVPDGWEKEQERRDRAIDRAVRSILSRQYDPGNMPTGPDPIDAIVPEDPTADAREWQRRAEFVRRMNTDLEETVTLQRQLVGVGAEGFGDALTEGFMSATKGAESFGRSFARVADSVVQDIQRIAIRQLVVNQIMGALGSAFSGGASMSKGDQAFVSAAADKHAMQYGGAHGGTWRVGGMGGLDSQLVTMKLTPGELVRVTNGANSGTGGEPLHATLVVRPPAVIADEVMAKASPAAKAALVYSSLQRGGRRGSRPRE